MRSGVRKYFGHGVSTGIARRSCTKPLVVALCICICIGKSVVADVVVVVVVVVEMVQWWMVPVDFRWTGHGVVVWTPEKKETERERERDEERK